MTRTEHWLRHPARPPGAPWWLSGQLNMIAQAQPGFRAPYTGDNSFRPDSHGAVSRARSHR